MYPIKFKKITDEDNILGFDEIIVLDKQICRVLHHHDLPHVDGGTIPGHVNEYEFLCIADGHFMLIQDSEWCCLTDCYKVTRGE